MPRGNMPQYPFHPYEQHSYNQYPFPMNGFPFNQQSNIPPNFFTQRPSAAPSQPQPQPQNTQQSKPEQKSEPQPSNQDRPSPEPQSMGWNQQPMGWNQPAPGNKGKGFFSYFQDKDGQVDLDKMLNTANQVANTYQQFTPIFKGISSFMKGPK